MLRALSLACVALACAAACQEERAPPPPALAAAGQDGADGGGGPSGLVLTDAGSTPHGPCGEQRIPAITTPPNLSFVVDRSASMRDIFASTGLSKYENARISLANVLRSVGHRVNYGVTVFPGLDGATGCEAGDELLEVLPGDPPSYARDDKSGPRLLDMLRRLSLAGTSGGTPVAPTLAEAQTALEQLSGQRFVVLITDGAPNCNWDLSCEAIGCIPNIEGLTSGGQNCTQAHNCCAPTHENPYANLSCIDDLGSLAAVKALADAGIGTFVVGMPGSEPYVDLLDAMAVAGGTAREGEPRYYSVEDTEALEKSLTGIAASVAITCDLPLDYEPKDPDYVNVYFDDELVEYDPDNGWAWTDEGHVSIRGSACEELTRGDVLEVQIFAGCKTVVK